MTTVSTTITVNARTGVRAYRHQPSGATHLTMVTEDRTADVIVWADSAADLLAVLRRLVALVEPLVDEAEALVHPDAEAVGA